MAIDAEKRPSLYTKQRGSMRYVPGMPGVDTLPPRTISSVYVQQGLANMLNEGGSKPADYFTVAGPAVMRAEALGHPGEMMARVIRECGGK